MAGSFQHIRSLTIFTTCLEDLSSLSAGYSFDLSRLPPGSTTLDLDELNMVFDEGYADDAGPRVPTLPSYTQRFLVHLNPRKLSLAAETEDRTEQETPYIVSREAAHAMSRWTRLRLIEIKTLDLVTADQDPSDGEWDLEDVTFFFRSLANDSAVESEGPVSISWDLSHFVKLPTFFYDTLLDVLLERDDTLYSPWLESFTVIFRKEALAEEFQRLVAEAGGKVPQALEWQVALS